VLEFAVEVRDANEVEYIMHKRHKDKRVRGEWFMLNEQDVETVKNELVLLKEHRCHQPEPQYPLVSIT